jgi:hypothetical protein
MRLKWRLSRGQWDTVFGAVQATCVLLGTVLAVYGIFFTSLPERILREMRADIAEANEQLIDLRRERRAVEAELGALHRRLSDTQGLLDEKSQQLAEVESQRSTLIAQLRTITRERQQYFTNTYQLVVQDFLRYIRSSIYDLRQTTLMTREYPLYRAWLSEGEQLLSELQDKRIGRGSERAIKDWYDWVQREPEVWRYSHLYEDAITFTVDQPFEEMVPTEITRYSGYLRRLEVSLTTEAPNTGYAVITSALGFPRLSGRFSYAA